MLMAAGGEVDLMPTAAWIPHACGYWYYICTKPLILSCSLLWLAQVTQQLRTLFMETEETPNDVLPQR